MFSALKRFRDSQPIFRVIFSAGLGMSVINMISDIRFTDQVNINGRIYKCIHKGNKFLLDDHDRDVITLVGNKFTIDGADCFIAGINHHPNHVEIEYTPIRKINW